jgi:hypothetical protein
VDVPQQSQHGSVASSDMVSLGLIR